MELGLDLDLLMCNYSSALAYTLHLTDIHACALLDHRPMARSAPLVCAARGSAQRQNLVLLYQDQQDTRHGALLPVGS